MPSTSLPHRKNLRFVLATDLDHTLVRHEEEETHDELLRFNRTWHEHLAQDSLLVYSTGRSPAKYLQLQNAAPLLVPDVLVCSVGTEIFWRNENGQLVPDEEWKRHLGEDWERERLQKIAASFDSAILTPQNAESVTDTLQSDILLSQESIEHVCPCPDQLTENGISAKVLFSGGQHLDLLPRGGGKGPALAYILNELRASDRYPIDGVQVNGDSGNDIDLFTINGVRGCIVANAMPELKRWAEGQKNQQTLFHATRSFAGGIVEALEHFGTVKNGNENEMMRQLLDGMDEIIKVQHVMFLSDDLTLQTPQETVTIGHDEAKVRAALQIAQGSLVFIDALRAERSDAVDSVHCHLCQITYSAAKGVSRTVLPVSIEMCRESDGAYLWTAIHLESDNSYGGFA